jgi:hypothetical protein
VISREEKLRELDHNFEECLHKIVLQTVIDLEDPAKLEQLMKQVAKSK